MSLRDRLRVYLVADFTRRSTERVLEAVGAALAAGTTAVQYRDKSAVDTLERRRRAERLAGYVRSAGALFVVNDDPDLAVAVAADAVHLGPRDRSISETRARFGRTLIIGGSAGDAKRARQLEGEGADYLGVGAIFEARASKADASAPRGLATLTAVVEAVDIPIVAIGGVDLGNAGQAIAAGADGVAVVRAILDAPDAGAAALGLAEIVATGRSRRGGGSG